MDHRSIAKATLSPKGQITIPVKVRKALHIEQKRVMVGFEFAKGGGVLMKPLIAAEREEDFSENEWDKLEKLANQKGNFYPDAKGFLTSLEEL